MPDIPAVREKLVNNSVQQKKTGKEDTGILNIENEPPKAVNKVRYMFEFVKKITPINVLFYIIIFHYIDRKQFFYLGNQTAIFTKKSGAADCFR